MKSILRSELFEHTVYQKKYPMDFLSDQLIENNIDINTKQASGSIREIQLDGIVMISTDIHAPKGYRLEIMNNCPLFVLHFEIGGHYSYTPHDEHQRLLEVSDFQYNMLYLPKPNGVLEYKGGPCRTLEILFTLDRIKKIAGDNYSDILQKVAIAVKKGVPYVFWEPSRPISLELEKTLEELIACPLCGHFKKTYLQSKITSLIVDVLIEANDIPSSSSKSALLKSVMESLHTVELHIKTNLNKTLTIAELAIIAGFNESKLKRDFKLVYGSTIFKYITKLRMEKAISLIRHEDFTVAQAAYEVGYNNPQHFTKAFKRTLGYLPKMLKKLIILMEFGDLGLYLFKNFVSNQ